MHCIYTQHTALTPIEGNMMSVQLSRLMMMNTVMNAWNMSSK